MARWFCALVACLLCSTPALADVRQVRAGEDLQAALKAAKPGDELRLAPGATFTGNFVLPATTGNAFITIRTDLPDASLPPANQRVTPATAAVFAKIVSPDTAAALRTAPGAHHWRVMFIDFPSTKEGYGDIIQLGDGSSAQNNLSQVPHDIIFDRVYIHGHPLYGQKRGIALNAATVTIRNCYISDIKAAGFDTQAIGGWNGPGPYSIENNYLEASGEGFLLGGSDPPIPNLVPEDVSVRYNHMSRPMSWRDPIIPAPAGVTAAPAAQGALPPGTHTYRVVARRPVGQGTTGNSTPSSEVSAVVTTGGVTVAWAPVKDATEYRVYGRNPSGVWQYWTATAPTFTDRGTAGTPGNPPSAATLWQVKNIFELKSARRVKVEFNLFENNWKEAQPGYAIVLTPRNQDGRCTWCVIESVDFSHNIVRNTTAAFNISGYDSNHPTLQTRGIRITENLIYGVTTALGGNGWAVLIGDEPRDVVFDRNTFEFDGTTLVYAYGGTATAPRAILGFQFVNNAAAHGEYGINGADASTGTLTLQKYFPGAVVTGNWLSGGKSSKYPPGNRFDSPFNAGLSAPARSSPAAGPRPPGADVPRLLGLVTTIRSGLMTGVSQPPTNLGTVK
jgi:hypothetical protein